MLFESLDKIKRNSIMSAIILIALGFIIMVCPENYIGLLTLVFVYILVIIAIVMILNFFSSNKSIIEYLKFCGALIIGIIGFSVLVFSVLVFRDDIVSVLAWLFGLLLILDGVRTLFHSFCKSMVVYCL